MSHSGIKKTRLNRRLLFVGLGVVFAGGAAVWAAHKVQVANGIENARRDGLAALEAGEWDHAAGLLKHYLQFNPDDMSATESCARALQAGGYKPQAFELYEKVLKARPRQFELRRTVAQLAVDLNWQSPAREHVTALQKRFAGEPDVEYLAGRCDELEKNFDGAVQHYVRARLAEPLHVGANRRLAVLYEVVRDQPGLAAESIKRLKASNDESPETLQILAEYAFRTNEVAEAYDFIERVFDAGEMTGESVLLGTRIATRMAIQHASASDESAARGVLETWQNRIREAIGKQPESVFFDMSLSRIQHAAGLLRESLQTLEGAVQRVPANAELRFQLAWRLIEQKQFDDVSAHVTQLPNSEKGEQFRQVLSGMAALAQRKYETAAKHLREVVATGSAASPVIAETAALSLATCCEAQQNWLEAAIAYREVLQVRPEHRSAKLGRALAELAAGRHESAIAQLRNIPQPGKLIRNTLIATEDKSDDNQLKHTIPLRRFLNNGNAELTESAHAFLLALVAVTQDDFSLAAEHIADKSLPVSSVSDDNRLPDSLFELVSLSMSGQPMPAETLERVVKLDRDDPRPAAVLFVIWAKADQVDRIDRFVREQLTGLDELAWHRAAKALATACSRTSHRIRTVNAEAATKLDGYTETLFRRVVQRDPLATPMFAEWLSSRDRHTEAVRWCQHAWKQAPGEAAQAWLAIAQTHPEPAKAIAELEKWLVAAVRSDTTIPASVCLTLADVYLSTSRYALAQAEYAKVIKSRPDNVAALNNLAWLLAMHGEDVGQATLYINRAIGKAGRRPDLLDTRGCVSLARNDTASAITDFEASAAQHESADTLFHLAVAHRRAGDVTASQQALSRAVELGLDLSQRPAIEQHLVLEVTSLPGF